MIPLRLELKNFMSYGEDGAVLDLAGMHMLSLTGENGNGKSALLDAITWSLWGESRAGKNHHDDLVRIGADEMSVALTFIVDGQTYRVLRKRSKRASGNQWELQQQDGEQWRALTGNRSGDTGDTIQRLLRMSYDTFLNSAYLRQGQADQFVRQTPGKRKEILADILDLSRYDTLEAHAKQIAQDAKADAAELERDLNGMEAELAEEPALQSALSAAQGELKDAAAHGETLKAEWDAVRARLQELEALQQAADALRAQSAAGVRELDELAREGAELRGEIASAEALLARAEDIHHRHAQLLDARTRADALDNDVRQYYRGRDALAAAQREWDAAEFDIKAQARDAQSAHQEAVHAVQELPLLREQQGQWDVQARAFDGQQKELAQAETLLSAAQERLTLLREDDARVGQQITVWQERLAALSSQGGGACLTCNAPLNPVRIAAVREEYQSALDDLNVRRKDGRGEGARAKSDVAGLQAKIAALRLAQKDAQAVAVRLAHVGQEIVRVEEIAAQIPKRAAHLAEVTGVLQAGSFAPEVKARMDKIKIALARYASAEEQQAQAKAEAAALLPAERELVELGHAEKALAGAQARLARIDVQTTTRRAAQDDLARQLAALADVSSDHARLQTRKAELKALETDRQARERRLHQEVGSLTQRLERLAALHLLKKDKGERLSAARRRAEVHDQLTRAFGKKGVQALIIDNAVPELMEEANLLLERLTDGDMSLYINTVREGKSAKTGPVETLDIQVSDSLGTRPLEMYSGGEGFRASFALRIALSRLLARRAGAKLQTLIIDEGFGTQDGKGREKLVDALQTIAPDFERIIVITHIDELKDAFPTRVEVTKTPSGSQITVLEGAAG